jgi:hypothetical protein
MNEQVAANLHKIVLGTLMVVSNGILLLFHRKTYCAWRG